eukprot:g1527.t1
MNLKFATISRRWWPKIRWIIYILLMHVLRASSSSIRSPPQLGWASYNAFGVHVTDAEIRATADALVYLGLSHLGYHFLVIDDQWQNQSRAENGSLVANPGKFPHGIASLAEYVHSKGLGLGLYSDAGPVTCSGTLPGHLGYEKIDAETFAQWGVDYLKSDNCYPQGKDTTNEDKYEIAWLKSAYEGCVVQDPPERDRYLPMIDALENVRSIRNITFEMCLYGWDHVEAWGSTSGDHLWRATQDIHDTWASITYNLDCVDTDRFYETSGYAAGWAYADGLMVGHSLSEAEYRSHFALWAAIKSPLMIGFDVRGREKNDSSVVTVSNKALIDINQDALGKPARCRMGCTLEIEKVDCAEWWGGGKENKQRGTHDNKSGAKIWPPSGSKDIEVWSGPLSDGAFVVIVLNRADTAKNASFDWASDAMVAHGNYRLLDIWEGNVVRLKSTKAVDWEYTREFPPEGPGGNPAGKTNEKRKTRSERRQLRDTMTTRANNRTLGLSVIQEKFKWIKEGEEKERPVLLALSRTARRRYARNMKEYVKARAQYFATLGKPDPRTIDIASGLDANIRETICTSFEYETAEPTPSNALRTFRVTDFATQGTPRYREVCDWIGLRGRYATATPTTATVGLNEVFDGVERPKWRTYGPGIAIVEAFRRLHDNIEDVFPACLTAGRASTEFFKFATKQKSDFFRHPMIGGKERLVGGKSWKETVKNEAFAEGIERSFDGFKRIIMLTWKNVLNAHGERARIERYHTESKGKRKPEQNDEQKTNGPGKRRRRRRGGGKDNETSPPPNADRLKAQAARDWNSACVVCGSPMEAKCGGITKGDGKHQRMTTNDPMEDGNVHIGDVVTKFATDTMCDLPAVVSEKMAKTLENQKGVTAGSCMKMVALGMNATTEKITKMLTIRGATFNGCGAETKTIIIPKLEAYVMSGTDSTLILGKSFIWIGENDPPTDDEDAELTKAYVGETMYRAQSTIQARIDQTSARTSIHENEIEHWNDVKVEDGNATATVRTLSPSGTAYVCRNVRMRIRAEGEPMIIGRDLLERRDDPDSLMHRTSGYTTSRREDVEDEFEARIVEARCAGASPTFIETIRRWAPTWTNLRLDIEPGDPPAVVPPMKIIIKDEATTRNPSMYYATLSTEQRNWLPGHLKGLKDAGIIVKEDGDAEDGSYSPCLFPKKPKSKNEWRLVTDSRFINSIVVPVETDIPKLSELRKRIGGDERIGAATRFATLDIVKGYWMIPVRTDDQKYLRFRLPNPWGAWRFTRASMGFARSGNYFIQQVQRILEPIIVQRRLIVGTDDLAMLGRRRGNVSADDDLLVTIDMVMKLLKEYRIPVSPKISSMQLYGHHARWCGYRLENGSVLVDPERLAGLVNLRPPQRGDELVQFIGAATWIREHVPNFSALIQPLNDMKTKMFSGRKRKTSAVAKRIMLKDIGWDATMNAAFEALKTTIASSVITHPPDRSKKLILFTDASSGVGGIGGAWGGLLAQCEEPPKDDAIATDRSIQAIAFFGGTFSGHARKWHVPDKEAAAILFSLRRSFAIVGGRDIVIYTDAKTIKETFSRKMMNTTAPRRQRVQRWSYELLAYSYEIVHIDGERNLWADMMSRQYQGTKAPENITRYHRKTPNEGAETPRPTIPVMRAIRMAPHAREEARLPTLKKVVNEQRKLTEAERNGTRNDNGVIRKDGKVVIPEGSDLVLTLLVCAHQGDKGHRALDATTKTLEGYTWNGKLADIKRFVAGCISCMKAADGTTIPRPLGRLMRASRPYEVISMDFLTLPESKSGERHLLVIKDRFSRLLDAEISGHCDAYAAAAGLSRWLRSRPMPDWILSDGGTHFTANAFKILTENANRLIVRALRKLLHEFNMDPTEWPDLVSCVIAALNHTPSEMLKTKTPTEVANYLSSKKLIDLPIFARNAKGELTIKETFDVKKVKRELDELREEFEKLHADIGRADDDRHKRNAAQRDRKAKAAHYNIGEYVLVAKAKTSKYKTDVKWDGPFEIIRSVSALVYEVQRLCKPGTSNRGPRLRVHAARIQPFAPKSLETTSKLEEISWEGIPFSVEEINSLRWNTEGRKRSFWFGIRWKGFEKVNDTDEPLERIYPQIPKMVRKYVRKFKKISPDEMKDLLEQMDALDAKERAQEVTGRSRQQRDEADEAPAADKYGSELRDDHRDAMDEAWDD